ncbi:MAG: PAS domain S-box protein [Actinomycetota bacterium]|nr:PAS domain S-box protein [Actinomycetota bacterium]
MRTSVEEGGRAEDRVTPWSAPLRVLLVADSGNDAELLSELRRAGYDPLFERVDTPEGMERALSEALEQGGAFDVVISEYRTSRFGASEALTALRERGHDVPFIVVCDEGEEEAAVALMRTGAQDCVIRSRAARLGPAIGRELKETAVRRERERTAEALKQSEERFRLLADEAMEGIVLSRDGKIFDANRSFTRMYGYKLEELVGMSAVELVPPDLREMVARRISDQNAEPYESKGLKKDGTVFPVEVRPRRIPYEGRQVRVTSVLDLTDRKLSEGALRASEEEHRAIFELAGVGKAQSDPQTGRLLRVNPKFCEITGYSAEELRGMTFLEITHPEDREVDFDRFRRMVRGEGDYSVEKRYIRKDGHVAWVSVNATVVRDEGGRPVRTASTIQDITERKRAEEDLRGLRDAERASNEEALREAQERFRSAFDNAPIGVAIVGLDGRFLQVNRSLCEILGYPEEQLLATSFQEITHPDDVEASMEHVRRAMEDEIGSYSLEKRYLAADGRPVWVSLSVSLVRDAEGDPLYFVDQIQDITERKLAEKELARRAEELTHANAELEQFSYSVSHDLRAPLRSIDGFSQILLEDYADRLDEEGRAYLGRVRAASQHMGHLMDDLLDLSRVSRGPLRSGRVDLSALAREIVEELEWSQPGREAEFVVEDGLEAEGDARLLAVALENLLGNAWKFTSKKPAARIEFGSISEHETRVYYVRDDGAGFDAAYAERLFGAFQRLHNDDDFEGTGIGLATVQRVIHRHGGRLWAEGEVGKGATFYFTL